MAKRGLVSCNFNRYGSSFRAVALDATLGTEGEPGLTQIAEKIGRLVEYPREEKRLALLAGCQALSLRHCYRAVRARNGVTVRIDHGMPQELLDTIDHLIAYGMLHVFRFVMDFVPMHVERMYQKKFDQPVPSQHA